MRISDFLNDLKQQGGELYVLDDKVRYTGPAAVLTPPMRAYIAENKPEIVQSLQVQSAKTESGDFLSEVLASFSGVVVEDATSENPDDACAVCMRWQWWKRAEYTPFWHSPIWICGHCHPPSHLSAEQLVWFESVKAG